MAYIESLKVYSKVLGREVGISVFLPSFSKKQSLHMADEEKFDKNRRYKTLVLLHGYGRDETAWMRFTKAEMYAEDCGIAVVCPDGGVGHYSDWEVGEKNLTYMEKEMMPALRTMFPLSQSREDNFVGGASMVGYGAMKWAFTYPGTFSHVISFSGGVDMEPRLEHYKKKLDIRPVEAVFGDLSQVMGSPNDIFWLMRQAAEKGVPMPRVYACVGDQDAPVYGACKKLEKLARALGIDITTSYGIGKHDFIYWDQELKQAMYTWLPLNG